MAGGVERVEKALEACTAAGDSSSAAEPIREYLRLVREFKLRQSGPVATFGSRLLQKHRSSLPQDELWTTMEQVAEAAADVGALDLAFTIVSEIRKKFPDSQRAMRITAIYFEAKGKFKEANDVLGKLLEDHPDSHFALKRQVAMEKTKGNLSKAIELLRAYVDTFMMDREAWEELAELYLQAQMYPQAAHCYEELLMHMPQNVPLYVQYADVLYTMGGSNIKTARQYYAAALKLSNGENTRALYGVCCTAAAGASQKVRGQKDDEELSNTAAKLLQKRYLEQNESQLPFVKELLKLQGLA